MVGKLGLALAVLAAATATWMSAAEAQTKAQRCEIYARDAARATPTSTGLARGAARGAVVGSISGNAGRGAATGAAIGGTRRVAQKSRSYNSYFNECMSR
jgi:hypothetical protein